MRAALIVILLAAVSASAHAQTSTQPGSVMLGRCLVSLIHDVQVPAQEAGVLVSLEAREGLVVEADTALGRISDSQPLAQQRVAQAELQIAEAHAANDIDVRYAEAAAKVAEFAYRAASEANARVAGAASHMELQQLLLAHRKATLHIEQAEHAQQVVSLEIDARRAEYEAVGDAVERRKLKSPVSGEIVEVYAQVGEWVKPGDPVFRIVRLDRLRIEGFVNAADVSPDEIAHRPVEVICRLARGRVETFQGKVVFIHPKIEASGEYRVWAEVVNRMENDQWLLRPGHQVEMNVHAQVPYLTDRPRQP